MPRQPNPQPRSNPSRNPPTGPNRPLWQKQASQQRISAPSPRRSTGTMANLWPSRRWFPLIPNLPQTMRPSPSAVGVDGGVVAADAAQVAMKSMASPMISRPPRIFVEESESGDAEFEEMTELETTQTVDIAAAQPEPVVPADPMTPPDQAQATSPKDEVTAAPAAPVQEPWQEIQLALPEPPASESAGAPQVDEQATPPASGEWLPSEPDHPQVAQPAADEGQDTAEPQRLPRPASQDGD